MYPVSNAFLEAVKANTRKYYWTGRVTTTAGTVYEFDQDDMVKGSGYITSQCCGSTEIELGTVYAAEMGISLFSEINRYTLEDAKVELFYHLQIPGGSYERIPMGIFEVSEANRKAKCLEIKAYDYMVRFEKAFTSLESIGNAYDFMVLCSTACEVTLAQDRATIEAMPNGTENLSIYSDNDIETYRDVLFYVGQVLGGFFRDQQSRGAGASEVWEYAGADGREKAQVYFQLFGLYHEIYSGQFNEPSDTDCGVLRTGSG